MKTGIKKFSQVFYRDVNNSYKLYKFYIIVFVHKK